MDCYSTQKEVVHDKGPQTYYAPAPDYSGLQVGLPPSTLPEALPSSGDSKKYILDPEPDVPRKRQSCCGLSRKRIFILLAISILLVVAIVVGVVVGVIQSNNKDSSNSNSSNESETNESKPGSGQIEENSTGPRIATGSSLAITGYRRGNRSGFEVRLFYQDGDGNLRVTSMDSATNSWTAAKAFAKAKKGTPLAAATHNQSMYDSSETDYQPHVFYLDEDSKLKEHVFRMRDDFTGSEGPLSGENIQVANNSRLGAFWPSVAYQDPSDQLSEARFNCTGSESTDDCWGIHSLDIYPQPGSPLAQVPRTRTSGLLLYHQQQENKHLVNYKWENTTDAWELDEYDQEIPQSAAIAAYATPRGADTDANNQFLLWQDKSGKISFSHRNSGRGWKAPQADAVFDSAKKGTQMTCLNAPSWVDDAMVHRSDMNRCFFIDDNDEIRQVHWDGYVWKDLGVIRRASEEEEGNDD